VSPSGARELGRAFEDADVVRNYRYRQPYPPETFDILERLLVEPRNVLDAGSGTGALTIGLARFARRVDAIDPSAAMHSEARRTPGGDGERIRWILGTAESAPLDPPYGLVTAGASIHWMDPDVVMPRFRESLAPGAVLAIVNSESDYAKEAWRDELIAVIQKFSPSTHHLEFVDLVRSLEASGHFTRIGERTAAPVPYEQSVDDYMAMLASTSSLSRTTLGDRADDFERGARAIFARHGMTHVRAKLAAEVVWGHPE
jgi:SAM-dependent methyltransferase